MQAIDITMQLYLGIGAGNCNRNSIIPWQRYRRLILGNIYTVVMMQATDIVIHCNLEMMQATDIVLQLYLGSDAGN